MASTHKIHAKIQMDGDQFKVTVYIVDAVGQPVRHGGTVVILHEDSYGSEEEALKAAVDSLAEQIDVSNITRIKGSGYNNP